MTLVGYLAAILAVWTAGGLLAAFAIAYALRVRPAPDVWDCRHCDTKFIGAATFADHIIADHYDVLPRVDA